MPRAPLRAFVMGKTIMAFSFFFGGAGLGFGCVLYMGNDDVFFFAKDNMFVSLAFYEEMKRKEASTAKYCTQPPKKSKKNICESPKKTFAVFQDYDGRACPNAPPRSSKCLDRETHLIRKKLFE